MRTLLWMAVAAALAAPPSWAAEKGKAAPPGGERIGGQQDGPGRPPGPPPEGGPGRAPGDRQGGPPPGGRMGPPPGGFGGPGGGFDAMSRPEIFDAARQTIALPDDARKGVDQLEMQFNDDLQAAMTEARLKLAKAYVEKLLALVPEADKPKYQAVANALTARDETLAAAQKELKGALDLIKVAQAGAPAARDERRPRFGPPGSMTSKTDILRTHFTLTDEQRADFDQAQREGFDAMRERTDALFAELRQRGGPPDPTAFRRIGQAMRQVREEIEDQVAKAVAPLLTAEQKKDYETACAAIDAWRKKVKDAEAACRAKIVEAVGEEKAAALLGPPPGQIAKPPKKAAEF
ncbi:MAG TPA: hypothetical protein PLE19_00020 [Planctomycetota bacterium]|nr:hypothetical protein [Planctomycetota bacterium]HRR83172.1 hypothetical protein [Planctomycetota bacterium]HRT93315.1 hypothetical protein [Planctomycetota bacterium]